MKDIFDKKFLSPIRLHPQPELEVEVLSRISPDQQMLIRLEEDQKKRLSTEATARVLGLMDRSVTRLPASGGDRGFGGRLKTEAGESVVCRGRGQITEQLVRQLNQPDELGCREVTMVKRENLEADGSFLVSETGERVLFIVTQDANLMEAEKRLDKYVADVAELDWPQTTRVTIARERELRVVARELKEAGKPVMYVTSESGSGDPIGLVSGLRVAPVISRIVAKVGMKIEMVVSGDRIGPYGRVVKREEGGGQPVKRIVPLLSG